MPLYIYCYIYIYIYNSLYNSIYNSISLHGKPHFLFPDALKSWSFHQNCTGTWSFLYCRERWHSLFPKIWSYTIDGKSNMIFLKIYMEIWYFLHTPWKDGLSKKERAGASSLLYYLERWYFFPKNMILFHWAESETRPFSGNTWKHDASSSEEKQKTWYIGLELGFSLNLFGWRYSAMNNLQYFVPFSPQGLCLGVFLGASNGYYFSIRG